MITRSSAATRRMSSSLKRESCEKNQSTSNQQTNNSQPTVGPAVAGSPKERKT